MFGSYAKNEANGDSDIDIALVYSRRSFSKFEDLFELISFIKDIMGTFQKNIDIIFLSLKSTLPTSSSGSTAVGISLISCKTLSLKYFTNPCVYAIPTFSAIGSPARPNTEVIFPKGTKSFGISLFSRVTIHFYLHILLQSHFVQS